MSLPVIPPTPITNKTRKPKVVVPTTTLYHNASIPGTAGYLCMVINFAVQAKFFGTTLDTSIAQNFWNFSEGFHLVRRSGVGQENITLDAQTITTQKVVRVMPVGSDEAILVADLGGSGASHDHFTTASGDKFPVYDMPLTSIATFPQLRAASANGYIFSADFGSNFATQRQGGTEARLNVFSQKGKLISVQNGNTTSLLYLDGSHNLCQGSGSDITAKTIDLLNAIPSTGEVRFSVYVNESNNSNEYLEHAFPFAQHDFQIPLDDLNHCITVKYNANAANNPPARWSSSQSRVEFDALGAANLTMKASIVERPNQEISGS